MCERASRVPTWLARSFLWFIRLKRTRGNSSVDFGRHHSDVQCSEKPWPWPRSPRQGLTRHWRIGDRDIPWQVASQQSLPPFLPAQGFHPNSTLEINHWTSERCLPKSIFKFNQCFELRLWTLQSDDPEMNPSAAPLCSRGYRV